MSHVSRNSLLSVRHLTTAKLSHCVWAPVAATLSAMGCAVQVQVLLFGTFWPKQEAARCLVIVCHVAVVHDHICQTRCDGSVDNEQWCLIVAIDQLVTVMWFLDAHSHVATCAWGEAYASFGRCTVLRQQHHHKIRRKYGGMISAALARSLQPRRTLQYTDRNERDCEHVMQQPGLYPVPSVVERTPDGDRVYDIQSMLLKHRSVFVGSPIDMMLADGMAALVLAGGAR
jgi:hypothetical protein